LFTEIITWRHAIFCSAANNTSINFSTANLQLRTQLEYKTEKKKQQSEGIKSVKDTLILTQVFKFLDFKFPLSLIIGVNSVHGFHLLFEESFADIPEAHDGLFFIVE
jgi:hypothetical protein